MHTIPTNYTEVVNSVDSVILVMRREFDTLIENNTFESKKALINKNIVGIRCFFLLYKVKVTEVMSINLVS